MSIFSVVGTRPRAGVNESTGRWQRNWDGWLWDENRSGIRIDERTSMAVSDWYKAVAVISDPVATLPLKVYKDLGVGKGKQDATNHYLYPIVHSRPNDWMTSSTWLRIQMGHILNWGDWYSYIDRNEFTGRTQALWPLLPHTHRLDVSTGVPRHFFKRMLYPEVDGGPQGYEIELKEEELLHVPGMGYDGIRGYNPMLLHAEALGLSKGAEKQSAAFYGNGALASGFFSFPPGVPQLSPTAEKRFIDLWNQNHQGPSESGKIGLLYEGMTFQKMSVDPLTAQHIDVRKFQRTDIAGLLKIPPHMLGDPDPISDNNVEHISLSFLRDALMPWFVRIEQEFNRKLFMPREIDKYFVKFNVNAMMRGDTAARTQFYREMFYVGAYSDNMILESEDLNPIGPEGDTHFVQLNLIPLNRAVEEPVPGGGLHMPDPNTPTPAAPEKQVPNAREEAIFIAQKRIKAAYSHVFSDVIGRILSRNANKRPGYAAEAVIFTLNGLYEGLLGEKPKDDDDFIARYAMAMARRSIEWLAENQAQIVADELDRATKAIMEKP